MLLNCGTSAAYPIPAVVVEPDIFKQQTGESLWSTERPGKMKRKQQSQIIHCISVVKLPAVGYYE